MKKVIGKLKVFKTLDILEQLKLDENCQFNGMEIFLYDI
jgi:hypothetical protein